MLRPQQDGALPGPRNGHSSILSPSTRTSPMMDIDPHEAKQPLHILDIARLTVCMLGVQFTWTVELGYGTPYLMSLGLSKALTPLVWLAGPLSGLIIQPLVGVFSDTLDWKLGRRRPFILVGALLTIVSMLVVAYAKELAVLTVGQSRTLQTWTIAYAVIGFYCLDFSINAVQASCRSLILDIPPTDQQETCNAWSGWMNNLGSVVGFFAGQLNLVQSMPWLGKTQIKALAHLAVLFFVVTLGTTCLSVKEAPYVLTEEDKKRSSWSKIGDIWRALRKMPKDIQQILNVQFFAWMGWFSFLFYTTTWVGEILARYRDDLPPGGGIEAERAGSFALLCWACVAVVSGVVIPRLTPHEIGLDRWPRNPFTLRNLWTMSLVWFAFTMGMTWFVDDLWGATLVIALCGVPWAIALWVPFAMVGETISNMKDRIARRKRRRQSLRIQRRQSGYGATAVTNGGEERLLAAENHPQAAIQGQESGHDDGDDDDDDDDYSEPEDTENDTLLGADETQGDDNANESSAALLGHRGVTNSELEDEIRAHRRGGRGGPHLDVGLVLGVHNIYIVVPQFVDALVASCLFALIGAAPTPNSPSSAWTESDVYSGAAEPVGWILRFGGLMALVAAYFSRRI